jgi:hypothetical protein
MSRIILGLALVSLGAVVAAQVKEERPALGTIAKAAQEEKAKAAATSKSESKTPAKPDGATAATADGKTEKPAAKKYSNEDLGRSRPWPTGLYLSPPPNTPYRADRPKDEAYWRGRAQPILERQRDITSHLTVLKARLESIKGDGLDVSLANGQSSPLAAERRQLTYQVADFEAQLKRYEQLMAALEDEGRRAGALPGWFR